MPLALRQSFRRQISLLRSERHRFRQEETKKPAAKPWLRVLD
jgi:hypothetical protein